MSLVKRFSFFFLLVLFLTTIVYYYLGKPTKGIDDANIFLKYAQNIADGYGFVFNAGGEKVEGFTSFLWVLICAACFSVSANPEFLLLFICLVLTTLTITIVYGEVKKDVTLLDSFYFKKYFFWLYCAFIVCIGPSFLAWSVLSLMENSLWNFLFALAVALVLQSDRTGLSSWKKALLVLTGILLVMTRPESFAWIVLFSILLFMIRKKQNRSADFPLLFFSCTVLASLALTYFRVRYFGYPLPNTYYAKVSNNLFYNIVNGIKYAFQFFTSYNPLITLLCILLVAVSFNRRNLFKAFEKPKASNESLVLYNIFIITVIILFSILLPFTTGGDHFGGFRFYQSILPLCAWGLPAILWLYNENIKVKTNRNWISLALIAVLFFLLTSANSLFNLKQAPRTQLNYEFYLAWHGRETANEFNEIWTNHFPKVGMIAVGGFALKYKGETIDLMGLNNTLMGHNKGERVGIKNHAAFNKEVFYQLQPDLMLPRRLAKPEDALLSYVEYLNPYNFENQAMKNIFNDSLFKQSYQPVLIQKNNLARPFFAFANVRFLNSAQQDTTVKLSVVKL